MLNVEIQATILSPACTVVFEKKICEGYWTLFYCPSHNVSQRQRETRFNLLTVGLGQKCITIFGRNWAESCFQQRDASGSVLQQTPSNMEDGKRKLMFFLAAETKKHRGSHSLFLLPSLSLSPIYSVFLNWSTSSPLLTEAKLLKTPLLKWSTHFTFSLWTWECGLQILCGNVLR